MHESYSGTPFKPHISDSISCDYSSLIFSFVLYFTKNSKQGKQNYTVHSLWLDEEKERKNNKRKHTNTHTSTEMDKVNEKTIKTNEFMRIYCTCKNTWSSCRHRRNEWPTDRPTDNTVKQTY